MVIHFIFSFVAACILALVAYLQSEASWWKGPLASIALFALGVGIIALNPRRRTEEQHLAAGRLSLWCSLVLCWTGWCRGFSGSDFAQIRSQGQDRQIDFGGGWGLMFIGLLSFAS